jgi:hypothetical protein
VRFQFSDPVFELPDLESVLDALEATVVGPETPMFDAARQSWQPVARHPEVRAAWRARARYRPQGTGPALPPLPPEEEPAGESDEAARRRAAYALVVRGNRIPVEEPPPSEPPPRRTIAAGLALVLVLLVLIGVAVVEIGGGLVRVAARAARVAP